MCKLRATIHILTNSQGSYGAHMIQCMKRYSLHGMCCSNVNCCRLCITPSVHISVLFPNFLLLSNLSPCKSKLRKPSQTRVAVGRKGLGLQGSMCEEKDWDTVLRNPNVSALVGASVRTQLSRPEAPGSALRPPQSGLVIYFYIFPLSSSWQSGRNGTCLFPFQAQQNTAFIT